MRRQAELGRDQHSAKKVAKNALKMDMHAVHCGVFPPSRWKSTQRNFLTLNIRIAQWDFYANCSRPLQDGTGGDDTPC
jgi:hypothetical protein